MPYNSYYTVPYDVVADLLRTVRQATHVIEARDRFLGADTRNPPTDDTAARLRESWRALEAIMSSYVPPEKAVDPTDQP